MLKGINYWAFCHDCYGAPINPLKALKIAKKLGFDCFELTFEKQGLISFNTTKEEAQKVRKFAESTAIQLRTLASGIGWELSPSDPSDSIREKAITYYTKMLEIASWLGVETILYLPGMVSALFIPSFQPQPYDIVDQRAKDTLRRILPIAEKLKIQIGIENVWNRYLLSPLEMRNFIDFFTSPFVGSYFDVGNVLLNGHPEHWIKILGHRIFAVHLKDFRVGVGNLDGFVDLLSGDVNFKEVMKSLKEIGYNKSFTAEIVPGTMGCVEKAISAMNTIERLYE